MDQDNTTQTASTQTSGGSGVPVPATPVVTNIPVSTPVVTSVPTGKPSTFVKIDKTKSNEQYIVDVEVKYIVPKLIRQKFPDLVKLIFETESMDDDEREYWLQIMPIMTEEQIIKFRNILVNEKEQLEKLDKDFKSRAPAPELDEAKLKAKIQEIKQAEQAEAANEDKEEEALLDKLNQL